MPKLGCQKSQGRFYPQCPHYKLNPNLITKKSNKTELAQDTMGRESKQQGQVNIVQNN
jgi:hypothetical protein